MTEAERQTLAETRIGESIAAKQALLEPQAVGAVVALADVVTEALRAGRKVMLFGNGGSAADATHLAAELVGRYTMERRSLPALSLTDNGSSMSAIGNDYDYAETFARQIRGLGAAGDVAIGLTTSGHSVNVIRGLEAATEIGMRTSAITGASGGPLPELVEHCLRMPSEQTARVQECTMLVGHTICELVERGLFAS